MSRLWCMNMAMNRQSVRTLTNMWLTRNKWMVKTCGGAVTNMLNVINMWWTTRGVSGNQGGKCWCVFNSISKIKGQSLHQQLQRVLVWWLLFTLLWAYQPGLAVFTWTLVTYHADCWVFTTLIAWQLTLRLKRFYFESEIHSEINILSNWLTIKHLKSTWCN